MRVEGIVDVKVDVSGPEQRDRQTRSPLPLGMVIGGDLRNSTRIVIGNQNVAFHLRSEIPKRHRNAHHKGHPDFFGSADGLEKVKPPEIALHQRLAERRAHIVSRRLPETELGDVLGLLPRNGRFLQGNR